MSELRALAGALAPAGAKLMMAELRAKMHRAEVGELLYGHGPEFDVEQMSIAPTVLELRLDSRAGDENEMHIRMYFTEPAELDGILLALRLAWKQPGRMGLTEQNGHAKSAAWRADQHFGVGQ